MRVMVMVRATKDTEAGVMPSEKLLTDMGNYNEELVKAGIIQAGEGIHPSNKGVRIRFERDQTTVVNGPFPTNEVVAGFWLWKVKSMDEAIEWAKRCPSEFTGEVGQLELRPVFEIEDFGDELTPEARAQEERLRAQVENG